MGKRKNSEQPEVPPPKFANIIYGTVYISYTANETGQYNSASFQVLVFFSFFFAAKKNFIFQVDLILLPNRTGNLLSTATCPHTVTTTYTSLESKRTEFPIAINKNASLFLFFHKKSFFSNFSFFLHRYSCHLTRA